MSSPCAVDGCIRGDGQAWPQGPVMCVPHRREWAADHEKEISTEEWEQWANEWAYDDGESVARAPPPPGMEEVECPRCGPVYLRTGSSNHRCGKDMLAPPDGSTTRSTWPSRFKTAVRPAKAALEAQSQKVWAEEAELRRQRVGAEQKAKSTGVDYPEVPL